MRTNTWVARLFLVCCLAMPAAALAQAEAGGAGDKGEKDDETMVKEVVVTATLAEQETFTTTRSVDVVDREKIDRKIPKSLPDMLDETTGVMVQKTNAGAGSPIIRGLVGPENLILVDGVRFNNSTFRTGPNQYLSLIDPWSLRRVEVLRGPGSLLYGSDAMGGVIQALTLNPRFLGERMIGLDGRGLFASAWLGGGGTGQLDWNGGPVAGYAGVTGLVFSDVRAGGGEEQPLSDYWRGAARLKVRADLGFDLALTGMVLANTIRGAGRVDTLNQGRHRTYDNDDLLAYVRLERRGSGLFHAARLNLSYHMTHETEESVRCRTNDRGVVSDRAACLAESLDALSRLDRNSDTVHTPGFFAHLESHFWEDRIQTVLGADGYFDFVGSQAQRGDAGSDWAYRDRDRGHFSDGSFYASLGAFLRADIEVLRIGASSVGVDGGVRVSHFNATAPDVPGLGDVDYDYTGVVGSAGLRYTFARTFNAYLDYSQGFRAPNLQETTELGDTGTFFEVPNDNLEPVFADTLEFGAKVNTDLLRLSAATFVTWLDGAINRETLSREEVDALGLSDEQLGAQEVVRRVNADSSLLRGLEVGVETKPLWGASVWGNAAWVIGDIDDQDGSSQPIRRGPPPLGTAGLRYQAPDLMGLYGEFFVRWAGPADRLNSGDKSDLRICEDPANPGMLLEDCTGTPGWVTYNLRGGFTPMSGIDVRLVLENLSDVNYKYHGSGIDAPGFNGMLELSATW